MNTNENITTKSLYSRRDVADIFGVHLKTVRRWEKDYRRLTPSATVNGRPRYSSDDIARFIELKVDGRKRSVKS